MSGSLLVLSMLVSSGSLFAPPPPADGGRADEAHDAESGASGGRQPPRPWGMRVDASLVGMRDNWLSMPLPELGLTVGRDLGRQLSVELTGSVRRSTNAANQSWSALAALRWVAGSSGRGRHRATLAAGPFVEFDHASHGTVPFAHVEAAYVYRARTGFTLLIGVGPNVALAKSAYQNPPSGCQGDAIWCFDSWNDAEEIHAGDVVGHGRFAAGWQF